VRVCMQNQHDDASQSRIRGQRWLVRRPKICVRCLDTSLSPYTGGARGRFALNQVSAKWTPD
jgi:hypothetical protein